MHDLPLRAEQLTLMIRLARYRSDFWDPFFRFLNFFDSQAFFLLLITILWIGYSYRWGLRLFYWTSFGNIAVHFWKNFFGWARPSADFPEIGMIHPYSFGFPSGAATLALFLGAYLIYSVKKSWTWPVGILYTLLISFSRIYLGVHYPLDILGGWILGGLIFLLAVYAQEPIEGFLTKKGEKFSFFASASIPLAVLFALPIPSIYANMGAALGVGVGAHLSLHYDLFLPDAKNWSKAILRSIFAALFLWTISLILPKKFLFFFSFSMTFLLSFAISPIYRFLERRFSH